MGKAILRDRTHAVARPGATVPEATLGIGRQCARQRRNTPLAAALLRIALLRIALLRIALLRIALLRIALLRIARHGGTLFGSTSFGSTLFGGTLFGGTLFGGTLFGGTLFRSVLFRNTLFGGTSFGAVLFGVALLVGLGCGARTDVASDASLGSVVHGDVGRGNATSSSSGGSNSGGGSSSGGVSGPPREIVTGFDKVDLLFVVDNSLRMGDKQSLLADSVPQLMSRLTNPDCIDASGRSAYAPMDPGVPCPTGTRREFSPVRDIHAGVVTSALGDFGGDTCPEEGPANASQNDHAWLVGALPRTDGSLGGAFLSWAPDPIYSHQINLAHFSTALGNSVRGATEIGCGFEMPFEAMYRFLVDPKPPRDVATLNASANHRTDVDDEILAQRKAFLRPDSLVVVVVLSDENDCSMRDDSYSWVAMTAAANFRMWRGSSVCATNPNDPCCFSCMLEDQASEECRRRDTECARASAAAKLARADDDANVRCRQMKQRFGIDLLFPPTRYVNALTLAELCPDQSYGDLDCNCSAAKQRGEPCSPHVETKVPNPLFSTAATSQAVSGPLRKDAQAVFLVGIVGVPWQDLALDHAAAPLQLRPANALDWELFAPPANGDYAAAQLGDPFMSEQFAPRAAAAHPITGDRVSPPESPPTANAINGHEWYTGNRDVQYACTFRFDTTPGGMFAMRECSASICNEGSPSPQYDACLRRSDGCACLLSSSDAGTPGLSDPRVTLSPLCQDANNGYGLQQFAAGAFPGLRELQVLRGFYEAHRDNKSIVGSICPKRWTMLTKDPEFGYNPVMRLLGDELAQKLKK